ncbi:two-component system response regulator YesN [Paenibacillus cellulosilyticus]|uniref:Two-component system response regulator YesN n=1 Tax=Paenibacillus cellulosilyticus TaxID=375489 RepID=A0A2V2YVR7_9BACL|nr:response regulator [Paenibacillus cellulosilyticus]PWW03315.1 two-component system response regulator YesN [Paenibacillus cellulosilyticus]QKS43789.1 response regulator [Paenibacillus cellulosilyticus]
MIRVLIVDDDKLVRKGLISSMPWQACGMEIVGEANNGENALKFLEQHHVELLITDLAMPVMSGIELIRIVRDQYPDMQIVVLSLHQDFEYIQEALRLGAIDYIAKTQLEQEQFEEVLGRIVKLMGRKAGAKGKAAQPEEEAFAANGSLHVYYALNPDEDPASASQQGIPAGAVEAEPGIWYANTQPQTKSQSKTATQASHPNIAHVHFHGLTGMDRKSILQLVRAYGRQDLFYHHAPSARPIQIDATEYNAQDKESGSPPLDPIKEKWGAADWIYTDAVFQAQLTELKSLKLPPVRLARIFYSLSDEWNRLYQTILAEPITIEDFFASWYSFEQWLLEVRERISRAAAKPLFSPEIQNSIVKAMSLAQQHISNPISSAEIAQMVNMSGSYFSQCFKQYVGQTYTDYVRDIRIERAKEYLRSTTRTIQWIAEQIGYSDEKYFSRLFREHAGILPSEYRQQSADSQRK